MSDVRFISNYYCFFGFIGNKSKSYCYYWTRPQVKNNMSETYFASFFRTSLDNRRELIAPVNFSMRNSTFLRRSFLISLIRKYWVYGERVENIENDLSTSERTLKLFARGFGLRRSVYIGLWPRNPHNKCLLVCEQIAMFFLSLWY